MNAKKITALAAGMLALLSLTAQAGADGALLGARDWSVNGSSASLQTTPPTTADVVSFLNSLGQGVMHVCSFRIADLDADGRFDLAASVDYSGRQFCNTVLVVTPRAAKAGRFAVHAVQAWNGRDVGEVLRPQPHGGPVTLEIPRPLTEYDGAECVATLPALYRLDHSRLEDLTASPQSDAFYRMHYEALNQEISAKNFGLAPAGHASPAESKRTVTDANAVCKLITLDKLARLLKFHPAAGLERAQRWIRSEDTALKRKAVRVLADIGTDAARNELLLLSRDNDPSVAQMARLQLAAGVNTAKKLNWGEE